MAEYSSPGVYVEEFSSGIKPMEGVSTSVVGFVGMTERGPVRGVPTFISSFGEFQRMFGGYLPESYGDRRFLPMAVEQFFANGGSRCYVVRLFEETGAECASINAGPFTLKAANPGEWGNKVVVQCKPNFTNPALWDLMVADSPGKNAYAETFAEVSLNPEDKNYIVRALNKSLLLRADPAGSDGQLKQTEVPEEQVLHSKTGGTVQLSGGKNSKIVLLNAEEDPPAAPLGDGEDPAPAPAEDPAPVPAEDPSPAAPDAPHPADAVNAAVLKGNDGGPGNRTGLCALQDVPEVSIVVAPGVTNAAEVQEIITHCELMQNRVCILDLPLDTINVTELKGIRQKYSSAFAALYHPWIQVFDPLIASSVYMPPSGAMAGVYARTDNTRGVHKAPANETIRNCTGLSTLFGKPEQDELNPIGVNLIRNIPGLGIRVWGARTLSSDPEWRYINVRRLFIYIEETIRRNTSWAVFEPNDQLLWTKVRGSIASFLSTLWRDGALFGASESEAFFVNIGKGSTMTDDDILNGRLVCVIGVAPVRPAEFVIFRITQIMEQNG